MTSEHLAKNSVNDAPTKVPTRVPPSGYEQKWKQASAIPMSEHVRQGLVHLLPSRQASLLPHLNITLREPFAGLDHLDDVDVLLKEHENAGDAEETPRDPAIHLIGSVSNVSR